MEQAAAARVSIVLDAMGSDHSPENEIQGALSAIREAPGRLHIILAGKREQIQKSLAVVRATISHDLDILDADEVIEMGDEPVQALRQKQSSSIVRGLNFVKEGNAQAFVSAGNTGAVMSGSTLILGRIPGVSRPTIGSQFPRSTGGFTLVFDVGATVDSRPNHLREYAVIGSIFSREMFGVQNPKVGLLSVGEEDAKGNELVFAAAELLKSSNVNFVGNVEGNDVLRSTVDVIVCDGFVGNIVLKFAESVVGVLRERIRYYSETGLLNKLKSGIVAAVLRVVLKDFDYQEYGGVPLLGVNGVSIIGHGRSSPKAIKNMLLKAEEMVKRDVTGKIRRAIAADPKVSKPVATNPMLS